MFALITNTADMQTHKPGITFIFSTVVVLTLISGITSLFLSFKVDLTDQQKRILESTSNTWLMGTGTIFGLLGSCSSSLYGCKEERDRDQKRS